MPMNNKIIKKLFVLLILNILLLLVGSIVYSAELEVFVNSYEPDKNRALIQIQNSGDKDLHDVTYSVNSLPKINLVELLPSKASNIILKALIPGEYVVKVETKEGITVEQKIVLGRTEQQIAKESNAKGKNAFLTAAQIENSLEAQEKIKATQINLDAQMAALRQVQQENRNTLEQELKKSEDEQKQLFDAEQKEREALKQKNLDAKLAAQQKSSPEQQTLDQKKEFPSKKEKNNLAFNVSIAVLLIIGIIFVYYMFKKQE